MDSNLGDDFIQYVNRFTNPDLLKDWATFHGYINNPFVLARIRQLEVYGGLQHSFDVTKTWKDLIDSYQSTLELIDFGRKYKVLQDDVFKGRLQELEKVSNL